MATLEERMRDDVLLRHAVHDEKVSNREIGRMFGIDESTVRRYRARNIVRPNAPLSPSIPVSNGTAQWHVGVDLTRDRGEGRTLPVPVEEARDMSDAELLESMSVDPEKWSITSRRESKWQSASGEWLSAHKVELGRVGALTGDLSVDQMNEILEEYSRMSVPTHSGLPNTHKNRIFVVPVADLQAGKVDGGGTAALVDRFGRVTVEVRDRLAREGGTETLIIPILGDCIEGLVHQGGRFITRLDISVTEQVRVYRRLLLHMIQELEPYCQYMTVVVLPGNHDETYRVVNTPVTDSWAIEGASAVEDALALSGRYERVKFIYPGDEELVITLNVGTEQKPYVLAFTHGHLAKTPNSVTTWWGNQAFGKQHGGNADLLFSGHFHHLRVENMGSGRTWFQAPALDGGSDWYRRTHGSEEPTGMISLWVTPGRGLGWEGLTIHTGE